MKPSIHNYSGLRPVHGKARALFAASSLGILLALPAGAVTVIPVTNHSFQAQVLVDSDYDFSVTSWTRFTSNFVSESLGINNSAVSAFNPDSAFFTSAAGNTAPTGADGSNVLSTYNGVADYRSGVYQTITGTTLTAGLTYTMTVAIGDYNNTNPANWNLAIGTSSLTAPSNGGSGQIAPIGTHLATLSGTGAQLTNNEFKDFTFSYTATGAETGDLRIAMWAENSAVGTHVAFDNVRLSVIPEPSAALLGGIGCLLLLRRRSR